MAAAAFEEAAGALVAFAVALRTLPEDDDSREYRRAALRVAGETGIRVSTEMHRIEMRFLPTHPICLAYREVEAATDARRNHLFEIFQNDEAINQQADAHDTDLAVRGQDAFAEFARAVRDEIGIRQATAVAGS